VHEQKRLKESYEMTSSNSKCLRMEWFGNSYTVKSIKRRSQEMNSGLK